MRTTVLAATLALLIAAPLQAAQPTRIADAALARAATLRDAVLQDDTAWRVTESLTTEVGARPQGSAAIDRARDWGSRWSASVDD